MFSSALKHIAFLKNYYPLQQKGIMGMNARNISYISRYNPRRSYPLVDNKLETKKLALAHHLSVPDLLGVIQNQHDVSTCATVLPADQGFCIKPSKGSGGKGILVIKYDEQGQMCRSSGSPISLMEIQRHISNILSGLFSLGGGKDVAMIESLIQMDESLNDYSVEGVPDIRVIVFLGIPVMAMIRLSCHASKGKANLHQGAVGVGLDIRNGKALRGVQLGKPIEFHPDTGCDLSLLKINSWDKLIPLACACYDMTELGYIGVDLVLDKNKGPILLELNARPGLAIQVANNCGLLPRLQYIESQAAGRKLSIEERIELSHKMIDELEKNTPI